MNTKLLLRPALTIILGFIGALVAKNSTPPEIFEITGKYFLIVAALAFGTLGFILPDILELAGKAGIAALASQIAGSLPQSRRVGLPFRRRGQKYNLPLVVDTSSLIDGRIVEVAKTGFLTGTLLVIPSVISELHKLADSADDLKRARGRHGLDTLGLLQAEKNIKVEVLTSEPKDAEVDSKLIKLAHDLKGKVITVDYNLNKVAKVRKVAILNVNELANAVKTPVLPNEKLTIHINTVGKEKNQGVGYLSDGTMVVVEDAAAMKGKTVDVLVLRVLQTAAGKMIFAKQANG